jgi:hypothetical protein
LAGAGVRGAKAVSARACSRLGSLAGRIAARLRHAVHGAGRLAHLVDAVGIERQF